MRKLIGMVLFTMFIALGANAQISTVQNLISPPSSGSHLTDTVTNAGTVVMSSAIVKGAPNQTTVTTTFTKLTGTVAGVATLQGSINATDWATASATTYTVTDVATATNSWQITGKNFLYYRVSVVGSGTSTYTVKGQVLTVNP